MATKTHTAPIGIERINDVFYVTPGGFATIQSAVDYARTYNGGFGQVIIGYGVSNSDSIPALTGGTAGILLTDLRNGVTQNWTWDGTQYVGWVRVGARSAGEDWTTGASSVTSILDALEPKYAIVINPPSPVEGVPGWVLLNWDSGGDGVKFGNGASNEFAEIRKDGSGYFQGTLTGSALYAYESFDPATAPPRPWGAIDQYPGRLTRIVSGSADATPGEIQLIGFNSDSSANQVWMTGAAGNVDFPTAINFRGPLNFFGASQAKVGGIDGVGHLTAVSADFQNCNVTGSPVRTFANTADAPSGMQWPPAGIGVSTGTAWAASIDPATVPRLNVANTFTGRASFIGGLDVGAPAKALLVTNAQTTYFDAYGADAATHGTMVFRSGVLNDGVPRTLAVFNSVGNVTFPGIISASALIATGDVSAALGQFGGTVTVSNRTGVLTSASALINADASGLVLCPPQGANSIYFNWDQGTGGVFFGNGAGQQVGRIDGGGVATLATLRTEFGGVNITAGDWNTFKTGGFFVVSGLGLTNQPPSALPNGFLLWVLTTSAWGVGQIIYQMAFPIQGGTEIWIRSFGFANVWSGWFQISSTAHLADAPAQGRQDGSVWTAGEYLYSQLEGKTMRVKMESAPEETNGKAGTHRTPKSKT